MQERYLYMALLGANPPGRCIEQHDFCFAIGHQIEDLLPHFRAFWPEAGNTLHLDGWRRITHIEGFDIVIENKHELLPTDPNKLFFLNLGGYQYGILEEQHLTILTVAQDRKSAIRTATNSSFFKARDHKLNKSASPHIDEKYAFDVDDIYHIEDLLSEKDKAQYSILLRPNAAGQADEIRLGYQKF